MTDYEAMILERQEAIEIAEDNHYCDDNDKIELHYNPIVMKMIEDMYVGKAKELMKRKAPDGAFNNLIKTLSNDETIDNQTYAKIYGKIMDIYKGGE